MKFHNSTLVSMQYCYLLLANVLPVIRCILDVSKDSENPVKYAFQYDVEDGNSSNYFGHSEKRIGSKVEGKYYVVLPDNRIQRVHYHADHSGYYPKITYEPNPYQKQLSIGRSKSFQFLVPPNQILDSVSSSDKLDKTIKSQKVTQISAAFPRSIPNHVSVSGPISHTVPQLKTQSLPSQLKQKSSDQRIGKASKLNNGTLLRQSKSTGAKFKDMNIIIVKQENTSASSNKQVFSKERIQDNVLNRAKSLDWVGNNSKPNSFPFPKDNNVASIFGDLPTNYNLPGDEILKVNTTEPIDKITPISIPLQNTDIPEIINRHVYSPSFGTVPFIPQLTTMPLSIFISKVNLVQGKDRNDNKDGFSASKEFIARHADKSIVASIVPVAYPVEDNEIDIGSGSIHIHKSTGYDYPDNDYL